MQEVGKEIKGYTELNGRTDSNLIDALNAMYNYGMTKDKLSAHMTSRELTFTPKTSSKIYSILKKREIMCILCRSNWRV